MARGDQLARQWKIFQTLVTSKYGKSVADLAKDLDCHQRTGFKCPRSSRVSALYRKPKRQEPVVSA